MDYMERALSLARMALGHSSPNPAVGAVLVKEGLIVGEGFTQPPGLSHAEIQALKQAGEQARGSTLYVTLEPCCHYGRTPPCTQAIVAAGVAQVHMAMLDPNPLVAGKGRTELEAAGVRTSVGERGQEAQELNEAYTKYITQGRPFVSVKFAMSLDGKIATRSGDSHWISGETSRERVHRLRALVDAVLVGVDTVIADDPELTARPTEAVATTPIRQPLRVVVDSRGRMPAHARMLRAPGKTLIATTVGMPPYQRQRLVEAGGEVMVLAEQNSRVTLGLLLAQLGQREVTSVLVEGGSAVLGSFFDEGLVDKVYAFIAPIIIGGNTAKTAVGGKGVGRMAEALRLERVKIETLDDDVLIIGYPSKRKG